MALRCSQAIQQTRRLQQRVNRTSVLRVHAVATPGSVSFNKAPNTNGNGVPPAPSVTVTYPAQVPAVLAPPATFQAVAKAGAAKTAAGPLRLLISGILAGCFIAYGGYLTISVQGGLTGMPPGLIKLIGGLIFPVGLALVTTTGSELYTGNTAITAISKLEGQSTFGGLLHNWFWSYVGNFLGSLAMVYIIVATGTLAGNPIPIGMAEAKASLPWATAFARAFLCNWLVCMAVWNTFAANTLSGKILGLWAPITCFVTIGLEHSVANMFFVPMGIALGAKVTFKEFILNNLVPVTLGNTLSGVLMVAVALKLVHGLKKPDAPPAPVVITA